MNSNLISEDTHSHSTHASILVRLFGLKIYKGHSSAQVLYNNCLFAPLLALLSTLSHHSNSCSRTNTQLLSHYSLPLRHSLQLVVHVGVQRPQSIQHVRVRIPHATTCIRAHRGDASFANHHQLTHAKVTHSPSKPSNILCTQSFRLCLTKRVPHLQPPASASARC